MKPAALPKAKIRITAPLAAALVTCLAPAAADAQDFNGARFEINRDRVQLGTIRSCAKSATYLVPTTYLYIAARTKAGAGGTLGKVGVRTTVYTQGLTKSGVQQLAAQIHAEIVSQLRATGATVLTFDDVRADVADKARMATNPRYGMPTKDFRNFPNIDFFVATPADDQAIDFGLMGAHSNFAKASERTGATLLFPQVWLTLPQIYANASSSEGITWRSSQAGVTGSPAMHLAGAWVNGLTAKGAWCNITIPEHGMRLPAANAGAFHEISSSTEEFGDWGIKRGDWSFDVDTASFQTGTQAVGRSLAKLISDTMSGSK